MDNKNTKLIFKAHIARELLKQGNKIVDIKPNRENTIQTIFVFEKNEKFDKDLSSIIAKKSE